jgi:hypothetical protein
LPRRYLIGPFARSAGLTVLGLARAWHETASKRSKSGDAENVRAIGCALAAHDAERK